MNKKITTCLVGFAAMLTANAATKTRPNVVFIGVDDLRTEINCYGSTHMHTPNLDRLARQGVLFERAYCQQAVCAPSRNTIMTGLRPDALGIYDLATFFRKKAPDVVTLAQHFKNNGFRTEAVGKIFHTGHGNQDDTLSWSVPRWNYAAKFRSLEKINRGDTTGLESDAPKIKEINLPYYCSDAPEENMSDFQIARIAAERIRAMKGSPFFMAVGFLKPHLPFIAPRKYWDLYDPAKIVIPERKVPEGMPDIALVRFGELRKYHGIPQSGFLDDATSRKLIHGYYACVSMIDEQVGKLLDVLKEQGLAENTIVILWGDHGWKLGEYGDWCKHTNVELDTNAPLIISAPGIKGGVKTSSLAEFVGIYPTLCDLAGLEKPGHLEGKSLLPILKDPKAVVNKVAISQYPRGKGLGYDNKSEVMGYSMRTGNYRFTRWQKYENPKEVVAVELYDHSSGRVATVNLAQKPEYRDEVKKMDQMLTEELSKYKLLKSPPK